MSLSQIVTILLTIFYVLWLCGVLWALWIIARSVQRGADALMAQQDQLKIEHEA